MLVGPRTRAPSHAARSLLNLNADSEGRHKPYGLWPRQHDSVRSYDLTYVQPSASPYGNERFLYPSETRRGGPYGSLPLRSSPRHYSQGERPMSGSIPEGQPYGCSSKGLVLLGGSRLLRDSSSHIETTVGGRSYDPRTLHGDKGGMDASMTLTKGSVRLGLRRSGAGGGLSAISVPRPTNETAAPLPGTPYGAREHVPQTPTIARRAGPLTPRSPAPEQALLGATTAPHLGSCGP